MSVKQVGSPLSLREREVMALLVEGKSNKLIAKSLGIHVGTVKIYVGHIYTRLGVRSRVAAAVTWERKKANELRDTPCQT